MSAQHIGNDEQDVPAYSQFQHYILGFITLIAGLLRSINLGTWSFATDEIFTLQNAQHLHTDPFNYRALVEHPITSSFVLFIIETFGLQEWAARLAPAIIGTVSIPIIYYLVKKAAGVHIALLTSLMLALSPWHLFWSQTTRFYILLLLLYTIGLFTFYWGIEKNSTFILAGAVLWIALAVSERLLALMWGPVIVVYIMFLAVLPFEKPVGFNLKNLTFLLIPGFILGLIFAWDFVRDPMLWQKLYFSWIGRGPFDVFWEYIKGIDVHIALLAVLGVFYGWRTQNRLILLLTFNVAVPLIILMIASQFQFTHNRYLFITIVGSFVLAAYGAAWLVKDVFKGSCIVAAFVGVIILLIPIQDQVDYHMKLNGWRIDWKSGFSYVMDHADEDALVMSNNVDVGGVYAGMGVVGLDSRETAVSQINASQKQTWFVISGTARLDPAMYKWITENGTLVYTLPTKVEIFNYQPAAQ